jgi:nondiscriminating aspartyl-tRNA synthetase
MLRRPEIRFRHRVSSLLQRLFREFLDADGFTEIRSPKITAGGTEGGSDVFALDYFGRPAALAQSPQLYKQMMVGVFQKVYETAPVFRAERHATVRHLNEYISLDVEMGFIRDHRDVMDLLERLLKFMLGRCRELVMDWPERFAVPWPMVPVPVPRIPFTRAKEILADISTDGTSGDAPADDDLSPEDERTLGEYAKREYGSDLLFIEGYPLSRRPFYTHPDPDEPGSSRSFDLLFRGQELVTGGQRFHRPTDYRRALEGRGWDGDALTGYLEAFEGGLPPHSGFAIGLERLVQTILLLPNIRQTSLFPRDRHRMQP